MMKFLERTITFALVAALSNADIIAAEETVDTTAGRLPVLGGRKLPVVDLGYALHRAGSFNETGRFYNFSNIRYAAPPVGNLRFRAPERPPIDRLNIDTGSVGRVCPQGRASWIGEATAFVNEYLTDQPISLPVLNNTGNATPPPVDPRETEDCLFLDVIVPERVFRSPIGAPVLVWIYGGGYTGGEKSRFSGGGSPAGLIRRSGNNMIFVSINYRLGAFGWLSGPSMQQDGTANAGLYDQRLALQWVQTYIKLFGGDPKRVTVMGESAGAGSIMHQITAYGGRAAKAPFKQAILQSPGFTPVVSNFQQETIFFDFLGILNVKSFAEARNKSSDELMAANRQQIESSPYGSFTFGPVVDGSFAPAVPDQLLARNEFDRSVNVMVGHNKAEGLIFTTPDSVDASTFTENIKSTLPTVSEKALAFLDTLLYPPQFSSSGAYKDAVGRAALAASDRSFLCHSLTLQQKTRNAYAYIFAVPPALHGDDTAYTFFDDGVLNTGETTKSLSAAMTLQEIIVSFVADSRPVSKTGNVELRPYGGDRNAAILRSNTTEIQGDDISLERCNWWTKGFYL